MASRKQNWENVKKGAFLGMGLAAGAAAISATFVVASTLVQRARAAATAG